MSDDKGGGPDAELLRAVWDEARDLVKRLEGSTVQRLEVQAGEVRIEIERGAVTVAAGSVAMTPAAPAAADGAPAEPDTRHKIVAPLVGTFYRAQQPGAPPFVEVGDVVDEGQTVAIVEAMKLMNQVKTDRGGRVSEIAVDDGAWVEFEQVLIYLEDVEA
jgi:acetyl-CoA carboxylase biotin carboxyl carrier protein